MKLVVRGILLVFVLMITAACGSKKIVYEGPTPTSEVKIVKEKSCN